MLPLDVCWFQQMLVDCLVLSPSNCAWSGTLNQDSHQASPSGNLFQHAASPDQQATSKNSVMLKFHFMNKIFSVHLNTEWNVPCSSMLVLCSQRKQSGYARLAQCSLKVSMKVFSFNNNMIYKVWKVKTAKAKPNYSYTCRICGHFFACKHLQHYYNRQLCQ